MKRNSIIYGLLLVLSVFSMNSLAQLSGELSGTIEAGTYTITGDISVEYGEILILEPGVDFVFEDFYSFHVNGVLLAVGTEEDSIRFIAEEGQGRHYFLLYESSLSRLEYCRISDGLSGGIRIYNGSPEFSNCIISNNISENESIEESWVNLDGGGIFIIGNEYANTIFSNCMISNNSATGDGKGGGIYASYYSEADLLFFNCNIIDNEALDGSGGGVYVFGGITLDGCLISGNSANEGHDGGGVFSGHPNHLVNIYKCNIINNYADGKGGGIINGGATIYINNCNIINNNADEEGGGLYLNVRWTPLFGQGVMSFK